MTAFTIQRTTPQMFVAASADRTFIFELARKGCRKVVASSYRNAVREADKFLPLRAVPLDIRRAAYAHLRGEG